MSSPRHRRDHDETFIRNDCSVFRDASARSDNRNGRVVGPIAAYAENDFATIAFLVRYGCGRRGHVTDRSSIFLPHL